MRAIVLVVALSCSLHSKAQNNKNYILEINGDTVSVGLEGSSTLKTKDGRSLTVKLKQKDILVHSDNMMSFQYPSSFTVSTKMIDDVEQILCMSGGGNGYIIQKYKNVNPENIVDMMLAEITEESKDAGYKETKTNPSVTLSSGLTVTGKRSSLVLDSEKNIFSVYPVKIKKGGLIIVEMIVNPDDKKEVQAFELFWKTLEIKD